VGSEMCIRDSQGEALLRRVEVAVDQDETVPAGGDEAAGQPAVAWDRPVGDAQPGQPVGDGPGTKVRHRDDADRQDQGDQLVERAGEAVMR